MEKKTDRAVQITFWIVIGILGVVTIIWGKG